MNSNIRNYLIVLILSILFGFINYLTPSYLSLINSHDFKILDNFEYKQNECNKSSYGLMCFSKYQIKIDELKDFEVLGLGFFPRRPIIYCDNNVLNSKVRNEPTNYIFDSINSYQIFNFKHCRKFVYVEVWDRKGTIRKGLQTGQFVVGSEEVIFMMKQLSEFFSRYIYLIFIFSSIPFFIFYKYLTNNNMITKQFFFTDSILVWALYLFVATGLLQHLIPLKFHFVNYRTIVWITSAIAHAYPLLMLKKLKSKKLYFALGLIAILNLHLYLSYIYFSLLIVAYTFTGIKNKKFDFIMFSIGTFLAFIKVLNFTYSPSGRLSSVIFFFLVSFEFYILLKELNINKSVLLKLFSTKQPTSNVSRTEFENLVHDIRTPLAVISNEVSRLGSESLIPSSVERLDNIVSNFNVQSFKRIDISHFTDLVNEKQVIFKKDVLFSHSLSSSILNIDINFLRVLSNLLDNALEACDDTSVSLSITSDDKYYVFIIHNHTKIKESVLEKLNQGIEFSTKSYGNGIGAKSSKEWIEKNNGTIEYKASGEVIIKLPLA